MDWQTFLFSFSGRVNRAKYWLSVLITLIVVVVAVVIGLVLASILGENAGYVPLIAAYAAAVIFGLWVGLAVGTKRLHDRDKSGWWLVLFYLVPAMLNAVGETAGDTLGLMLAVLGAAISIWGFVEMGCLKGTAGPNTYGPDPLAAEENAPPAGAVR